MGQLVIILYFLQLHLQAVDTVQLTYQQAVQVVQAVAVALLVRVILHLHLQHKELMAAQK
jgi:hypothetical protein